MTLLFILVVQCMPSLTIIGVMKSGTGSLMHLLNQQDTEPNDSWRNYGAFSCEFYKLLYKTIFYSTSICETNQFTSPEPSFISGTGWKVKPIVTLGANKWKPVSKSKIVSYTREKTNEVHYFGLNYELEHRKCTLRSVGKAETCTHRSVGLDYISHFEATDSDSGSRSVYFDKSPDYIRSPRKLSQMLSLLPHQKLLVMIRDPVTRMYSEFQHHCRHGRYVYIKTNESDLYYPPASHPNPNPLPGPHTAILNYLSEQHGWNESFYIPSNSRTTLADKLHLQAVPYQYTRGVIPYI